MYLIGSAFHVGVYEIDPLGERPYLAMVDLKERFKKATGKGKKHPPTQVYSTEPGGEAHTLAGDMFSSGTWYMGIRRGNLRLLLRNFYFFLAAVIGCI